MLRTKRFPKTNTQGPSYETIRTDFIIITKIRYQGVWQYLRHGIDSGMVKIEKMGVMSYCNIVRIYR